MAKVATRMSMHTSTVTKQEEALWWFIASQIHAWEKERANKNEKADEGSTRSTDI
jgi:hypothetical protein